MHCAGLYNNVIFGKGNLLFAAVAILGNQVPGITGE
jgi:hypothetical protein